MWQRRTLIAGWILLVAVWLAIARVEVFKLPSNGSDFGIYMAAAQALRLNSQASIYDWHVLAGVFNAHGGCLMWGLPYLYQPLLALLLRPLTYLSCASAWTTWQTLNLILWAYCTIQMAVWASAFNRWFALGVAVLSVSFLPLLQGLAIGQVHVVILATCVGGIALARKNHPYLAGAVLGFGIMIKYFPIVLVLYYLLSGKWRVAVSAAVVSAGLMIAQLVAVGPRTILASFTSAQLAAQTETPSIVPGMAFMAALAGLALVIGVLWANHQHRGNDQLGVAWALCTMLLVSPVLQWPYLTWLLPALAACLCVILYDRQTLTDWKHALPLALVVCVYGLIMSRMVLIRYANTSTAIGLASVGATFLLWVVCGVLYLRDTRLSRPAEVAPLPQAVAMESQSDALREA